ncbi:type 4a pilus biogenesis protein PilO [Chitinolyticbacter meiyuanensis]|uniref:type 4a pilus biogenesis protein PilO n=1 Tax=Chitinolyticbacter meiyuanensis TaxID=682798 RepID=UPI0011E5DCEA|nr:type 4a pilus biogenesis protein PilO [Chitinolyticbacter meiyuanensis]
MTLDELRSLDPKDIGNWPAAAQLGLLVIMFVVIVLVGHFYVWSDQLTLLDEGKAREEQLKEEFKQKKAKAVNLEAYRQQLLEIQQSFGALLKQLPNKSEMETLLTEINQAGVGRGLQFELFKPGSEVKTAEFAELPISIKISGSYHDLAAFVSDVAKLSRIVTLGDMKLTNKQAGQLTLEATVKTYRALDEAEQQEIRKAEAEAKKQRRN